MRSEWRGRKHGVLGNCGSGENLSRFRDYLRQHLYYLFREVVLLRQLAEIKETYDKNDLGGSLRLLHTRICILF